MKQLIFSKYFVIASFLLLIASCTPDEIREATMGSLSQLGQTNQNQSTATEIVRNCGNTSPLTKTITAQTSYSETVSWSVGGELGGGFQVTLPNNVVAVNIEAALRGDSAFAGGNEIARSIGFELQAQPNEIAEYTIQWTETWQPAEIQVTLPDGGTETIELNYRINISGDIVNINVENCDGGQVQSLNTPIVSTATEINMVASLTPDLSEFCPPIGSPDAIFEQPITAFGDEASSAGTGILSNPISPFGNRPINYVYVRDALSATCIQLLSPGTLGDRQATRQCTESLYNTNLIWLGTVRAGTNILLRRSNDSQFTNIGTINRVAPDARQYLVEFDLYVGDEICIEAPSSMTLGQLIDAGGYHLWFGRDLTVFTDSWCMILENNGSQHFCN
jgi:hypothetical protein